MAHSPFPMLIVLAASLGLLALWLSRLRASYLEPPVIFLGAWSIIVAFLLAGLVTYDRVLSVKSCVFLIASIAAFVVGAVAARTIWRPRSDAVRPGSTGVLSAATGWFLIAGSLVYLLLQVWDLRQFLAAGGFAAMSLSEVREEFLGEATVALSPFGVAKAIARATALMLAAGVPALIRMRRKWLAYFGVVSAVALLSESILAGGRIVLAYAALSMIYMHLHAAQAAGETVVLRARRLFALGTIVIGMFYGLLVVFPAARNPDLVDRTDLFLGFVHNAQVSTWVWKVSDSEAFASLPVFAFASTYLTQPVVKYTFFLEESDVEDWHLHGAYNFPIPAKVISLATGRPSSWVAIRADLAEISEQRGYSGNPWATGIRDLSIDFGVWGTMIALFLIGAGCQWLYEVSVSSRMLEWRIACALAAPVSFFLAFFSPFPIGVFSNTIAIALLWAAVIQLLRRGSVDES
jgi:hypothetical protein